MKLNKDSNNIYLFNHSKKINSSIKNYEYKIKTISVRSKISKSSFDTIASVDFGLKKSINYPLSFLKHKQKNIFFLGTLKNKWMYPKYSYLNYKRFSLKMYWYHFLLLKKLNFLWLNYKLSNSLHFNEIYTIGFNEYSKSFRWIKRKKRYSLIKKITLFGSTNAKHNLKNIYKLRKDIYWSFKSSRKKISIYFIKNKIKKLDYITFFFKQYIIKIKKLFNNPNFFISLSKNLNSSYWKKSIFNIINKYYYKFLKEYTKNMKLFYRITNTFIDNKNFHNWNFKLDYKSDLTSVYFKNNFENKQYSKDYFMWSIKHNSYELIKNFNDKIFYLNKNKDFFNIYNIIYKKSFLRKKYVYKRRIFMKFMRGQKRFYNSIFSENNNSVTTYNALLRLKKPIKYSKFKFIKFKRKYRGKRKNYYNRSVILSRRNRKLKRFKKRILRKKIYFKFFNFNFDFNSWKENKNKEFIDIELFSEELAKMNEIYPNTIYINSFNKKIRSKYRKRKKFSINFLKQYNRKKQNNNWYFKRLIKRSAWKRRIAQRFFKSKRYSIRSLFVKDKLINLLSIKNQLEIKLKKQLISYKSDPFLESNKIELINKKNLSYYSFNFLSDLQYFNIVKRKKIYSFFEKTQSLFKMLKKYHKTRIDVKKIHKKLNYNSKIKLLSIYGYRTLFWNLKVNSKNFNKIFNYLKNWMKPFITTTWLTKTVSFYKKKLFIKFFKEILFAKKNISLNKNLYNNKMNYSNLFVLNWEDKIYSHYNNILFKENYDNIFNIKKYCEDSLIIKDSWYKNLFYKYLFQNYYQLINSNFTSYSILKKESYNLDFHEMVFELNWQVKKIDSLSYLKNYRIYKKWNMYDRFYRDFILHLKMKDYNTFSKYNTMKNLKSYSYTEHNYQMIYR